MKIIIVICCFAIALAICWIIGSSYDDRIDKEQY